GRFLPADSCFATCQKRRPKLSMGHLDEIASEQFRRWEELGRGWQVWPYPVAPEPPFRPFFGFRIAPPDPEMDDGRKRGLLASLFDTMEKRLNPTPPALADA